MQSAEYVQTGERPAADADTPLRVLHLVSHDDIEYYFLELSDALAKLHEVPDADYERITVH